MTYKAQKRNFLVWLLTFKRRQFPSICLWPAVKLIKTPSGLILSSGIGNVSIGKNQLKEIFYLIVLFFQSGMKGRGRQKKQSESPSLPPPPGPGLTAGGRKKLVKGSGISPSAALDLLHKATMDSINCKPTPSFR